MRVDFFDVIDSKEKAYILGFIAGDGHLTEKRGNVEITTALVDFEIIKFISNCVDSIYFEKHVTNKQKKIYPSAETVIYSKHIKDRLVMMFGGRVKTERTLPRISKKYEPYLVQGFFDAEGCITWGYRKDRDRLWQKVSFTSQFGMLEAIQNILYKEGISTIIKPKGDEKCSIIYFSNEYDIYKFFKYLPKDSFYLKRKMNNFEMWLKNTREKYTFKIGDVVTPIDKRTLKKYNQYIPNNYLKDGKYVITKINGKYATLNNGVDFPIMCLSKSGISNYALRLELEEFGGNQ